MLANPIPSILSRNEDRRLIIGMSAFLVLTGMLGLIIWSGQNPLVFVAIIAIGVGCSFTLGMTLPLDNVTTPEETNAWNAFVMSIGYGFGAIGPLLAGFLRDHTGNLQASMYFFALIALIMVVVSPALLPRHLHKRSK